MSIKTKNSFYSLTLVLVILCGSILLLIQPPFWFYSSDISFHSAKILRAQHNEFFIDPVSGYKSIYPSLFHIVFGRIAGVFYLNSFQVVKMIVWLNFVGLFISFFCFSKIIIKDIDDSVVASLSLSLIFYAPTGKYILLANPSNFSFIFLILGISSALLYIQQKRFLFAAIGSTLLGVSINLWWFNIIPVACVASLVCILLLKEQSLRKEIWKVLCSVIILCTILSYNLWHYLKIRDILINYDTIFFHGKGFFATESIVSKFRILIMTFLTKGNLQFKDRLFPYASIFPVDDLESAHGLALSVHYYLIVLPFNVLLLIWSTRLFIRSYKVKEFWLYRFLFAVAILIVISSISILFVADLGQLRRVQFVTYILLLPLFFQGIRLSVVEPWKKILFHLIMVISILSLFFTVIHSRQIQIDSTLPLETKEVIEYINEIPEHENTRIFMLENDLELLIPFIRFRSFTLLSHPTGNWADPITGDRLHRDFQIIRNMDKNWYEVLRANQCRYLIFNTDQQSIEKQDLIEFYKVRGSIVFDNLKWLVIDIDAATSYNTVAARGEGSGAFAQPSRFGQTGYRPRPSPKPDASRGRLLLGYGWQRLGSVLHSQDGARHAA